MKYLTSKHNKKYVGWCLADSKLKEKLNYQQYLFIKTMSMTAVRYGLADLLNNDYEREIDLIDDTSEQTNMCIADLLKPEYEIIEEW